MKYVKKPYPNAKVLSNEEGKISSKFFIGFSGEIPMMSPDGNSTLYLENGHTVGVATLEERNDS